ncbi:unnamed protein product [Phytophthora fragariaefolia]|uniref:Unnamed protein product n=1 Tax=Phytophthora fragariaefolia TaxID=1490495 RepID=A0A9W7D6B1_9STRA|nr:unnamed protein product [Phytophthora fragariaefolia]
MLRLELTFRDQSDSDTKIALTRCCVRPIIKGGSTPFTLPAKNQPQHAADPSANSRSCTPPRAPRLPVAVPSVPRSTSRPNPTLISTSVHPLPSIQGKSTKLLLSTSAKVGSIACESVNVDEAPPLANTEQVVKKVFADVSRALVLRDNNTPHRNVGEMLPVGMSSLLNEPTIDSSDLFLDIGAGLGNIVAHVVIGTNAYKAVGIELRADARKAGWK